MHWLRKFVSVNPTEIKALLISCLYFYLVLCAYYIFRPIRNEMTIANGVENVQWLFMLGMFVLFAVMPIFGWITGRYKTRQFMAYCTLFFVSNLVIFFFLFNVEERAAWVTRAFFVWVNVFNMFIVSLFWSFMNDVYSKTQSKRLFAFIASGGTAGALTGPIITNLLVDNLGLSYLLLISAGVLACSVLCINWLSKWENADFDEATASTETHQIRNEALKGSIWDGLLLILKSPYLIGICLFVALYAISLTFVSIHQAELIEQTYHDPIERTKLFAKIDLASSGLALILQLLVTSNLIRWLGYRATLVLIPLGITLGFALMAAMPILAVMVGLQIFRRSGDYAIMKPAREMLFSVVSREEKYKAKNFIDTAILRTGDTSSAWLHAGARALGAGASTIPLIGIGMGVAWCAVAYWLGTQYTRKSGQTTHAGEAVPA
ncbi:MAG: Npt1/Npt2 family nucleotide transporter [Pseudomonadota bacterium]